MTKSHTWFIAPVIAGFLGAACQSGHTQSQQPQVIAVPQDEMSKAPGLGEPAVGDSTPAMQMVPATGAAAGPERLTYTACNVEGPYIAMTFDDGPKPGQTDRLLDMLKERGIKATFFVVGQNAAAFPELIQRMVAEGHEVGNHSWNHASFTKAGAAGVASQINQTDAALIAAGAPKPVTVRPPYGATNASISKRLNQEFGQKVIMWDVDPLDWKHRNSARVTAEILKNTKPGSIVLAHDIHASTVDAMPATLDGLAQKGFKFVTVSELIAMDRPQLASKVPAAAKPQ